MKSRERVPPFIDYTNMCRCSGYGFQNNQVKNRVRKYNHGNFSFFCLEQGIKFCNIYKLFSTGCNNSSRMRIVGNGAKMKKAARKTLCTGKRRSTGSPEKDHSMIPEKRYGMEKDLENLHGFGTKM